MPTFAADTSPASRGSSPAITRSIVVLPEPDRPIKRDELAGFGMQIDTAQDLARAALQANAADHQAPRLAHVGILHRSSRRRAR